jgi:hypothetical protein
MREHLAQEEQRVGNNALIIADKRPPQIAVLGIKVTAMVRKSF